MAYEPWKEMGITEADYFKQRYIEARQEASRLVEALEFYSRLRVTVQEEQGMYGQHLSIIRQENQDNGERARKALEKYRSGG